MGVTKARRRRRQRRGQRHHRGILLCSGLPVDIPLQESASSAVGEALAACWAVDARRSSARSSLIPKWLGSRGGQRGGQGAVSTCDSPDSAPHGGSDTTADHEGSGDIDYAFDMRDASGMAVSSGAPSGRPSGHSPPTATDLRDGRAGAIAGLSVAGDPILGEGIRRSYASASGVESVRLACGKRAAQPSCPIGSSECDHWARPRL